MEGDGKRVRERETGREQDRESHHRQQTAKKRKKNTKEQLKRTVQLVYSALI